jgi:hypothetical protein
MATVGNPIFAPIISLYANAPPIWTRLTFPISGTIDRIGRRDARLTVTRATRHAEDDLAIGRRHGWANALASDRLVSLSRPFRPQRRTRFAAHVTPGAPCVWKATTQVDTQSQFVLRLLQESVPDRVLRLHCCTAIDADRGGWLRPCGRWRIVGCWKPVVGSAYGLPQ